MGLEKQYDCNTCLTLSWSIETRARLFIAIPSTYLLQRAPSHAETPRLQGLSKVLCIEQALSIQRVIHFRQII
jgi:hypothetical protein